jgi:hypothetical protein
VSQQKSLFQKKNEQNQNKATTTKKEEKKLNSEENVSFNILPSSQETTHL